MKIGDHVCVKGYVDEIRKDTVIIRNDGGYFGTVPSEVFQPVKDYGTGYRAGQIDAIENVLVTINEAQTYKMQSGETDTYLDKRVLIDEVKALLEGAEE